MVVYTRLLSLGDFSNGERLLYSCLLYRAVSGMDGVYGSDGSMDRGVLGMSFEANGGDYMERVDGVSISSMSSSIGMSRERVRVCLDSLKSKGRVSCRGRVWYVLMSRDVVMGSYFPVDLSRGRLTSLLLFYFYLRNRSEVFGGVLDTWCDRLALDYGTSEGNVRMMLVRLRRMGLVEVDRSGSIKVKL